MSADLRLLQPQLNQKFIDYIPFGNSWLVEQNKKKAQMSK